MPDAESHHLLGSGLSSHQDHQTFSDQNELDLMQKQKQDAKKSSTMGMGNHQVSNERTMDTIADSRADSRSESRFMSQSTSRSSRPGTTTIDEIRLYKKRWAMLALFSLNSMMSACLFISLSAINNIISPYYDVEPKYIDWLSNSFFFIYTLLAIPAAFLMSYFGLRPILILSASFNALSCVFRYAGAYPEGFTYVLIGQLIAALGYCTILQVPARISSTWFGEHERAMATSIGAFMNIFGVALGFVLTTQIVKENPDMAVVGSEVHLLFLIQLVMTVLFLALTFLMYQENPPSPSSFDTSMEQVEDYREFLRSLKQLFQNLNFQIMGQAYAIYFGIFNSFSILLNTMVTFYFPKGYEQLIGWMGFSATTISIPSALVFGLMLDRYQNYRLTAVLLNACALVVVITFTIVLTNTTSFPGVFACYAVYGAVGIPYFCGGLEQAAIMTYPISESTSSAVILTMGNLYGFLLVLILGKFANEGQIELTGYTMVGLYLVSVILAACAKTESTKSSGRGTQTNEISIMSGESSNEMESSSDEKGYLLGKNEIINTQSKRYTGEVNHGFDKDKNNVRKIELKKTKNNVSEKNN